MLNEKRSRFCLRLSLLILTLALASCGYTVVREKGAYKGEVITVAVPVFKNLTFEPQISQFFTEAFTRELILSGMFDINKEGSTNTLLGTLASERSVPTAMNANGLTVQKTVYTTLNLALQKNDGRVIKNWSLTDAETYDVGDINLEEPNKRLALIRMAGRMARRFSALVIADIDRKAL
jgi:hypothetical protein